MIYAIIFVCVYGLITSDNLIKKIMCINILGSMVIFLYLKAGFIIEASAPLLIANEGGNFVNPVPQAIMLTAIVIEVCFNCLALSIIYKIYRRYGTINISQLKDILEENEK